MRKPLKTIWLNDFLAGVLARQFEEELAARPELNGRLHPFVEMVDRLLDYRDGIEDRVCRITEYSTDIWPRESRNKRLGRGVEHTSHSSTGLARRRGVPGRVRRDRVRRLCSEVGANNHADRVTAPHIGSSGNAPVGDVGGVDQDFVEDPVGRGELPDLPSHDQSAPPA